VQGTRNADASLRTSDCGPTILLAGCSGTAGTLGASRGAVTLSHCTRPAAHVGNMAEYNLLSTMSRFLDPQLVFALLEFANHQGLYKEQDVLAAQIEVLRHTNMVEFLMELQTQLHNSQTPPQELIDRRDTVNKRIEELQAKAQPIMDIILDENNLQRLRGDRALNSAFLKVCQIRDVC
jgi:eIF3 subunit 6 N terminal domain